MAEIFEYVAERNPVAASDEVESIEDLAAMLADYPQLGRKTAERGVKAIALSRFSYLVFFKIVRREIVVVRVQHDARRHPGFQEGVFEFAR